MADPAHRPGWHGTTPVKGSRVSSTGWRWPVLGLGALLLALVGILAAWLLIPRSLPIPYFVSIALSEYDDPRLPAPAFARQDAAALLVPFGEKAGKAFGSQQNQLLTREIDALRERDDRPLVVHLCALARVAGGEVYLLPADARLDAFPGDAKPLADVLRSLKACQAPNKLLLLDISRPLADPLRGILCDDVAEYLEAAVKAIDDPHLFVLAACSPGQVALVSEELQQSIFAYYLQQGLKGWADGALDGAPDGRITTRELAAFVRERVDRWSRQNYDLQQTPMLLAPRDRDFALVARERNRAEPPADLPEPVTFLGWLRDGWRRRDSMAAEARRLLPVDFRRLEAQLLRAEKRWRGGTEEESLRQALDVLLRDFETRLQRVAKSVPQPDQPRSLALAARQRGFKNDPAVENAAQALLLWLDSLPYPTDPKLKEEQDKKIKEFLDKVKGKSSPEVAWVLLRLAAEDPKLEPDKLAFLNTLLSSLSPAPVFAETVYLSRLAQLIENPARKRKWPTATVHQALRCAHLGELAANVDPRIFRFIRSDLEAATTQRRKGEPILFLGPASQQERAGQLLEGAAANYQQILVKVEALNQAITAYNQALIQLPGFFPLLCFLAQVDFKAPSSLFTNPIRRTLELGSFLENHPAPPPDELQARVRLLDEALRTLGPSFTPDYQQSLLWEPRGPRAVKNWGRVFFIDNLLEISLLSGPDRENLWQARRNLARKLHEETVQLDRRDDASPRPDMVPAMVYSTQAIRSEYQQGVHRARLALILLNLGEMGASGAKLESSLEQLKGPKVDSTALAAIGKGIRHIWAEEIPEELRRRLGKKEILAADRLSRILYPLDPGGKEDPAGAALSPTLALRREEAVLLWRWLADFYRQEGRFAGEAGTSGDFYFKAADEYGRQLP